MSLSLMSGVFESEGRHCVHLHAAPHQLHLRKSLSQYTSSLNTVRTCVNKCAKSAQITFALPL